jgi:hypothetical protein
VKQVFDRAKRHAEESESVRRVSAITGNESSLERNADDKGDELPTSE